MTSKVFKTLSLSTFFLIGLSPSAFASNCDSSSTTWNRFLCLRSATHAPVDPNANAMGQLSEEIAKLEQEIKKLEKKKTPANNLLTTNESPNISPQTKSYIPDGYKANPVNISPASTNSSPSIANTSSTKIKSKKQNGTVW
jgi:hypothetical protein